ncbi:MAG: esterase family protein [Gemmataceae bacterium]
MHREQHTWHSPTLGRQMDLLIHGHAGARMIVFPTSKGWMNEWEDRGMMRALGEHIHNGWLQIYSVSSVDAESWYAYHKWPGDRAWRHELYDRYLVNEVLPFSRWKNPNPFCITAGASFGAFHALTLTLKHPDQIQRVISMSGLCDIRRFLSGYHDENVYFNNPTEFIEREHDPQRLADLRKQDIILAVGKDDGLRGQNEHLSSLLWGKGIGNALRFWDGWSHDWPYWQKMMRLYVGGHD